MIRRGGKPPLVNNTKPHWQLTGLCALVGAFIPCVHLCRFSGAPRGAPWEEVAVAATGMPRFLSTHEKEESGRRAFLLQLVENAPAAAPAPASRVASPFRERLVKVVRFPLDFTLELDRNAGARTARVARIARIGRIGRTSPAARRDAARSRRRWTTGAQRQHAARAEPRGGVAPLRRQPGSRSPARCSVPNAAHSARDGLDFAFVGDRLRYARVSRRFRPPRASNLGMVSRFASSPREPTFFDARRNVASPGRYVRSFHRAPAPFALGAPPKEVAFLCGTAVSLLSTPPRDFPFN